MTKRLSSCHPFIPSPHLVIFEEITMFIFIVRHGECYGNIDANLGPDTALTPLGEAQVDRVGERLAELNVTHVVSSPLLRALGTAQRIADKLGLATLTDQPAQTHTLIFGGRLIKLRGLIINLNCDCCNTHMLILFKVTNCTSLVPVGRSQ
ncbi:MAG: histidine phosphatase family protein [Caldilineaceae bacterium]